MDERAKARFWSKVDVRGEDECWEWQAGKDKDGYGQFTVGRKGLRSHRVCLELKLGRPIRRGLLCCHTCDNPSCCNPKHLWEGTHAENVSDRVQKGRGSFGEAHPHTTLTPSRVVDIRELYSTGHFNHAELASMYGVSESCIMHIVRGRCWAKADGPRTRTVRRIVSADQAREIRTIHAAGGTKQKEIAERFGITRQMVSDIITGRTHRREEEQIGA